MSDYETPYDDMPQGYKDGVEISAKKLSDSIDNHVLKRLMLADIQSIASVKSHTKIIRAIESPFDFKRSDIGLIFIGHCLRVDGKPFRIIGVNCHAVEEIKEGAMIELLLEES